MSDERLHDGEPREPKLVPVTWTFKELIPRQEVQAVMASNEKFAGQTYEEVASELASNYLIANLRVLKHLSVQARNDYHAECEQIAKSIERLLADAKQTPLDIKAAGLNAVLEGSLTEVSANIVRANATALQALQKLEDGKTARADQDRVKQTVQQAAANANKSQKESC